MKSSIVFVSLERWDHIWRRNQFLCAGLARRGWHVLFVEPPRDVSYALRTRQWSELRLTQTRPADCPEEVTLLRPTKLLPNSLRMGRFVNATLLARAVHRAVGKLGFGAPVLWINDHSAVTLADSLSHERLVYDITDDWTEAGEGLAVSERTRLQDHALCSRADAVIVCSKRLFELKSPLMRKSHSLQLIPNGVDIAHYAGVADGSLPPCVDAMQWERPVFMYTGTLHAQRLDVDLVEAVARRMQEGTIVMVGPDFLSEIERGRLLSTGRVVMYGPVPYSEIPAWMSAADAFIVPHRCNAFVESLNPIKLWEYLAAGKPIISTNIAGFRDFAEVVRVCCDAEAFRLAMEAAAAEEKSDRAQRQQAIVSNHTWNARVDAVEVVLAGSEPRTQPGIDQ